MTINDGIGFHAFSMANVLKKQGKCFLIYVWEL